MAKTKKISEKSGLTNTDRSNAGKVAIEAFKKEVYGRPEDAETALTDLLCDLMHYADTDDVSFENALRGAILHYRIEVKEGS